MKEIDPHASVDVRDTNEQTPLMHVSCRGSVNDIGCLLSAQADINARNNKQKTSIIIATEHNRDTAVRKLLHHDPDITCIDSQGLTALTHAINFERCLQKKKQKVKKTTQRERRDTEANSNIQNRLHSRQAYYKVGTEGLNNHIRENHCGEGRVASANGMGSRLTDNGNVKTVFPPEWDYSKTQKTIMSVLHSPKKMNRVPKYPERLTVEGEYDSVLIRVVLEKTECDTNVITAYPTW